MKIQFFQMWEIEDLMNTQRIVSVVVSQSTKIKINKILLSCPSHFCLRILLIQYLFRTWSTMSQV